MEPTAQGRTKGEDALSARRDTHSTRWGWRPPAATACGRWAAGCAPGTPASHACSSCRCPSPPCAARCPSSGASGSRHSQCCPKQESTACRSPPHGRTPVLAARPARAPPPPPPRSRQDRHTLGTGHTLPSTPAWEGGRADSQVPIAVVPRRPPAQTRAGPQRRPVRGLEALEQDTALGTQSQDLPLRLGAKLIYLRFWQQPHRSAQDPEFPTALYDFVQLHGALDSSTTVCVQTVGWKRILFLSGS